MITFKLLQNVIKLMMWCHPTQTPDFSALQQVALHADGILKYLSERYIFYSVLPNTVSSPHNFYKGRDYRVCNLS